MKPSTSFGDVYNVQTAAIERLEAELARLRAEVEALRAEVERLQARAQAEPVEIVPPAWRGALRKLTFMARTSGGALGPDEGLQTACAEAEALLSKPYNYPPAAEVQRLRDAARDVVKRWDSPKWKDEGPTADVIAELVRALEGK